MKICGKCWETRGQAVELIQLPHTPFSQLDKSERRDHVGCARVSSTCPFCQVERWEGREFEIVHRQWRLEKGSMVDHFVTRRYPQVVTLDAVQEQAA